MNGLHRVLSTMAARFVNVDHNSPLLLPPDMRDWVPQNHIVHFIKDAVDLIDLDSAHVNHRGTGDCQFPPRMMLGLLIYCYATGNFGSRRIEALTFDSLAVRFLCADNHPDHTTICTFRTQNKVLLASTFHQVLELAAEARVLKVGKITLSSDGTKVLANASKHSAVSYGHAVEQMKLLEEEIAELIKKGENAESTPLKDGLSVPDEIKRREDRVSKLKAATSAIDQRAKERFDQETAEYQQKLKERAEKEAATGRKLGGRPPQAPQEGARDKDQFNFTDPESRIMKAGSGEHFEQSYNAQATVEVESRLIVSKGVTTAPNDKEQLRPNLEERMSPVVQSVAKVLVDSGFYSEEAIKAVEQKSTSAALAETEVLAATKRHKHSHSIAELEQREDPPAPQPGASILEVMHHRMETQAGKELYSLRKQTIEPVFGIIKGAMGFRQFSMRGEAKADLEWTLVVTAYNIKRLFHMGAKLGARN
jgi:transposase